MTNFEKNDKAVIKIGNSYFERTVLEVDGFVIYLVEGGDAFDSRTGKVWGSTSSSKTISHA